MKNTMKLCLSMIACMGVTLHSAEKLNPDTIIRKALVTGDTIDQATMNQLMQQQAASLTKEKFSFVKETVDAYIDAKQLVPARTISLADPLTATLARQHNQNLQQQLMQMQEPK